MSEAREGSERRPEERVAERMRRPTPLTQATLGQPGGRE